MFLGILDGKYIFLIRFFVRLKKSYFFVKWEPKNYLSQKKMLQFQEYRLNTKIPSNCSRRVPCFIGRVDQSCINTISCTKLNFIPHINEFSGYVLSTYNDPRSKFNHETTADMGLINRDRHKKTFVLGQIDDILAFNRCS